MTELRDIESLYGRIRTVLAYLDAPVLIVNMSYKTAYVNPAFETAFQVNFKDALGMDLAHYLPPSSAEALVEAGEKVKQNLSVRREVLHEGGRFYSVGVSAITDDNAHVTGLVYSFTDMTKERELEKVKAQFISTLLNDLHAPLFDILECFRRLETDLGPTDGRKSIVRTGYDKAQEAMNHVERLLHITDSMTGELKLSRSQHDLGLLVGSAVGSLQPKADRERVYIHTFPMKLPPIYCDQDKLLQVIIHLINNQINFAGQSATVAISGSVSAEVDPRYVFVSIGQTGRTLSPQELPEMIADDEKRPSDCDPECVAVAKIISAHGRRLSLVGVPDMGSAVVLTLPAK